MLLHFILVLLDRNYTNEHVYICSLVLELVLIVILCTLTLVYME
jgi:hypothetical protein